MRILGLTKFDKQRVATQSCLLGAAVICLSSELYGIEPVETTGKASEQTSVIQGCILASNNKPAAGAQIGWFHNDSRDRMGIFAPKILQQGSHIAPNKTTQLPFAPHRSVNCDQEGAFQVRLDTVGLPLALLAIDHANQEGALIIAKESTFVEAKLTKLKEVNLIIDCSEVNWIGRDVVTINIYADLQPRVNVGYLGRNIPRSKGKMQIPLLLPQACYQICVKSINSKASWLLANLSHDSENLQEFVISLQRSDTANLIGRIAPKLQVTDAIGINKDVDLEQLRGNWVLIEFWAYWCGPCISDSLPELIELYRVRPGIDRTLKILTIHSARDVRTAEEYEKKTHNIKQKYWEGHSLPFPTLIDGERNTAKTWGINSFPTLILIRPDGTIHGKVTLSQVLAIVLPENSVRP